MKIGISLLGYEPGNMGGIEFYALQLIKSLQKIDYDNQYYIFTEHDLNHLESQNFHIIKLNPNVIKKIAVRLKRLGGRKDINVYTLIFEQIDCDLIHYPFQVINVPGLSAKQIISVMDLQHEHYPNYFNSEDLRSRKRLFDESIGKANHIIAISEFTKKDIVSLYNIQPQKISVVHLAPNLPAKAEIIRDIKLPSQYFYYPAASWPHKNHVRLIDAFALFAETHPNYHLVLSGAKKSEHQKILKAINKFKLSGRVHLLGFLSDKQVRYLYEKSSGIVFPSLFEGFGMPVIEAMLLKRPVACSNLEVLNEVAGKHAIYFDPTSTSDIAKAMITLADQPPNKSALEAAMKHSSRFTFERTAADTLDIYIKVHEK